MKKDIIKMLKPFSVALVIVVLVIEIITFSNNCYNKDVEKTKDYLHNKEYSKAISLCLNLIERNEYQTELYVLSSDIYLKAKDYKSAKAILTQAIEKGVNSEVITEKFKNIDTSKKSSSLELTEDFEVYVDKSIGSFLLCFLLTAGLIPIIIKLFKKCDFEKLQVPIDDNIFIDENKKTTESFISECNSYVEKQEVKSKAEEWFISECNKYAKKQAEKELEEENKKTEFENRKRTIKVVNYKGSNKNTKNISRDRNANIKLYSEPKEKTIKYEDFRKELTSNSKVNAGFIRLIDRLNSEGLFEDFINKRLAFDFIINKAIENGEISMLFLQNVFKMSSQIAKLYIIILEETGAIEKNSDYSKPRKTLINEKIDITLYRLKYANIIIEENNDFETSNNKDMIEDVLKKVDTLTADGWEFEKFSAELLLKNGFIKADVTSGSNDYGVDIVATDELGVKYAIQCKCYSHILDNSAVQEVIAGQTMYKCQVAVVMTNQYFTDNAKTLADKNNVLLWDRKKLIEFIENANKKTKVE